jgi:hypothetical protein
MLRRLLCAGAMAALALCGCRATPGFHLSASITKPPVLSTHAPVSAIEAPPVGYAVEDLQPWMRYSRAPLAPLRAPRVPLAFADPCPPCPPTGQPEQLHAPKQLPKGKAQLPDDCPE